MLAVIENKWNIKYTQILPAPAEDATENVKHHAVPDKLKIIKNCSQNMNCLIQQANSSYDPSKILILQFPMPTDFLLPLPSLSNFNPSQLKPLLTQS